MFTGLIEEVGCVVGVSSGGSFERLKILAKKVLENTAVGDSIAVNGLCLTVTELDEGIFCADVMAESLRRSSLGRLRAGSRVNLERAMAADGRFGGHIVSGHIDGTGEVLGLTTEGIATVVEIGVSSELLRYIVEKGSVAIDGISLTVMSVGKSCFKVGVIPHTGAETTLLEKAVGDIVNIETDIIGKYVEKFLKNDVQCAEEEITLDFLAEHGF